MRRACIGAYFFAWSRVGQTPPPQSKGASNGQWPKGPAPGAILARISLASLGCPPGLHISFPGFFRYLFSPLHCVLGLSLVSFFRRHLACSFGKRVDCTLEPSVTMWPLTLGVLALQASGVLAGPVSRSTEAAVSPNAPEELQKLADLARSAFDETKSQVVEGGEVQKRGSSCAWHNVRVRKEW